MCVTTFITNVFHELYVNECQHEMREAPLLKALSGGAIHTWKQSKDQDK